VAGRIDLRPVPSGLENPELCLQLNHVAAVGLERIGDALLVVPLRRNREIFDLGKGRNRGLCALFLGHQVPLSFAGGRKNLLKVCPFNRPI
jgi:hypothetical protein